MVQWAFKFMFVYLFGFWVGSIRVVPFPAIFWGVSKRAMEANRTVVVGPGPMKAMTASSQAGSDLNTSTGPLGVFGGFGFRV